MFSVMFGIQFLIVSVVQVHVADDALAHEKQFGNDEYAGRRSGDVTGLIAVTHPSVIGKPEPEPETQVWSFPNL